MATISSSNTAAETGTTKDGDVTLQKYSGFLSVPYVIFRQWLWTFENIFLRLWNRQQE